MRGDGPFSGGGPLKFDNSGNKKSLLTWTAQSHERRLDEKRAKFKSYEMGMHVSYRVGRVGSKIPAEDTLRVDSARTGRCVARSGLANSIALTVLDQLAFAASSKKRTRLGIAVRSNGSKTLSDRSILGCGHLA